MKTLYCNKCGKPFEFIKRSKYYSDSVNLDANNKKIDIIIPPGPPKETPYTRVFTICPYVAKYIMDKERA